MCERLLFPQNFSILLTSLFKSPPRIRRCLQSSDIQSVYHRQQNRPPFLRKICEINPGWVTGFCWRQKTWLVAAASLILYPLIQYIKQSPWWRQLLSVMPHSLKEIWHSNSLTVLSHSHKQGHEFVFKIGDSAWSKVRTVTDLYFPSIYGAPSWFPLKHLRLRRCWLFPHSVRR